jgi:thermitase
MRRWLAWLLVLLGLLVTPAAFGQECVPNELLVKFRPGTSTQARAVVHRSMGAIVRERIRTLDVDVVSLPHGLAPSRAAAFYARSAYIEYAEPNGIYLPTGVPSDPSYGQEWGLDHIQAPQAWDIAQGRSDIAIAILDSGIAQDHEDLASKVTFNEDLTDSNSGEDDVYGHGTHLAGIAAAVTDNGVGIAGVGFRCSLINIKVALDDGSSNDKVVAQGILDATRAEAKVICMSFGSSSRSETVERAINIAWNNNVVLVASAGNGGGSAPYYPAAYENCIAVASIGPNDQKAGDSNFGPWVDVAAPGVGILSTLPNRPNAFRRQGYGTVSGTSQAAAFVAGLAGLVWSSPSGGSNSAVRARIEATCDQILGTGEFWARGRINAARAVGAIQ